MKFLLIAFLYLPCLSIAQSTKIPPELNWLVGNWNRISSDSSVKGTETWILVKDEWTGIATSIKNGDTIITETIRLKIINGQLQYIADVKGNKLPVSFIVTSLSDSGFICENPHHDFPKKIEYKMEGRSLKVTISDDQRKRIFNFVRQQLD